jgi:uncharacterized protein YciI
MPFFAVPDPGRLAPQPQGTAVLYREWPPVLGKGGREIQYIIKAYDGANRLEKRLAVRPRHLENMAKVPGKVICAGGLLDDRGNMKGSVLIMEFDSEELLRQYLDSEPYIREQVWETVEVEPMNVVIVNGDKTGS